MRIVSYNVRYFGHGLKGLASTAESKRRIAMALATLSPMPDVICLQEVEARSVRSLWAHRAHAEDSQLESFMRHFRRAYKQLGRTMPFEAWYFPAHVYGVGPFKLYTTGLSVLVNQRTLSVLEHNGQEPHDITHVGVEWMRRLKQTRICAHLRLESHTRQHFHVFNTHLSLPSPLSRSFWKKERMGHGPNQLSEAKALASFVEARSKGEPLVLCGDFNAAPATPVYQYFTRQLHWHGAQEQLKQIDLKHPSSFSTAGFMNLRMHLDHLFGSPAVHWKDLAGTFCFGDDGNPFHGLSDHVPLIASFDLPAPARLRSG